MATTNSLVDPEFSPGGRVDLEFTPAGRIDPEWPATSASLTVAQEIGIFVQQLSGLMVGVIWK